MALTPETKAERLLAKRVELENEIDAARKKAGIPKMETKLEKLKTDLVLIMVENEIDQVEGDGVHATLVKQNYGSMFVGTKRDLLDIEIPDGRTVVPLLTILRNRLGHDEAMKLWKRVTKRVVVPELVEEVVSEGLISVDDISPSFIEKQKKPYARVFKDS